MYGMKMYGRKSTPVGNIPGCVPGAESGFLSMSEREGGEDEKRRRMEDAEGIQGLCGRRQGLSGTHRRIPGRISLSVDGCRKRKDMPGRYPCRGILPGELHDRMIKTKNNRPIKESVMI